MKKLFIAILRLLRIYTNKAGDKVSELVTLKDQIMLLQKDLRLKIEKLDGNYKQALIRLEKAQLDVTETSKDVATLTETKNRLGRQGRREDFMEAAQLLEIAIPKYEMSVQKKDMLQLHVDNLSENRKEFALEASSLDIHLEQLQHEYEMHELNLEMGQMLYGENSYSPTLLEIKNKVKDMKAKDLGTQKFNKEVHQPSIQQLERKSKSLASTVDYEAEFVSLSTTGTLPRLEVQDKVRIPQTI